MDHDGTGFGTMWAHISALGTQLGDTWSKGAADVETRGVRHALVCGMGGSAAAAELVSGVVDPGRVRIDVHRDYGLPGGIGPDTLLVFSSYSGNTEEVLSAWEDTRSNPRVVISSGGELVERARAAGVPVLPIPAGLPPRASLGHGVGAICALLEQCAEPDLAEQVPEAVAALEAGNYRWGLVGDATDESLEVLARRLHGRLPMLYSGCRLTHAVACRWRAQLNENSKLLVGTAELPELDHNEVVGWGQKTLVKEQARVVALRDESEHPRVALRFAATREALGFSGEMWSERHAQPGSPLARMMGLVQEGDVLSCLLAREAGVDPVGVDVIGRIKGQLSAR